MGTAVASAESAEEYREQTRIYAENAAQDVLDSHFSVVEIDGDFLLKYTY